MQTHIQSIIEACANTASGMILSIWIGMLVYPLYGFQATAGQATALTIIFTAASVVRSYAWRRFFNWHHRRV